ncbi:MAG: hypothetical protein ACI9J2_000447 [Saprospiraceae bacterium]|jgi:hypothetical protein
MMKFSTSLILIASLITGVTLASGGGYASVQNSYYQGKYDLGKRIFETKLLYIGCPSEGTEMDASGYESTFPKLQKGGELYDLLSKKERKAAKYYLHTRLISLE